MFFQLSIAGSTSIYEKNHHIVFLSRSIEELYFCLEFRHFSILLLYSHCKKFHGLFQEQSYSIIKSFVFFRSFVPFILGQLLLVIGRQFLIINRL